MSPQSFIRSSSCQGSVRVTAALNLIPLSNNAQQLINNQPEALELVYDAKKDFCVLR